MFKNENNKLLLGSLFREMAPDTKYVKFSLHESHPGLVNARKTFVELEDPTGYEWSQRYLDGCYDHWTRLMATTWFREAYDGWMLELNAKFKARYLAKIKAAIDDEATPPPVRMAALKYLHTLDKPKGRTAGRPSKEEVAGELKRTARETRDIQDDMERIGLKVI